LKRIQQALAGLQTKLNQLDKTKIAPLKDFIKDLADAQKQLKTTSLDNYVNSLDDLRKQFTKLGVETKRLDDLGKAFDNLRAAKAKKEVSDLSKELEKARETLQKLRTANQDQRYGLIQIGAGQFRDIGRARNELVRINTELKTQNDLTKQNRNELIKFRSDLANSKELYSQIRLFDGLPTLGTLKNNLDYNVNRAKEFAQQLANAKDQVTQSKSALGDLRREFSALSKGNVLKFGIADTDGNASAVRKTIADIQQANQELVRQKAILDILKNTKNPLQDLFGERLNQVKGNIQGVNQELSQQKLRMQELELDRKRALQLTQDELNQIRLLTGDRALSQATIKLDKQSLDDAKKSLLDLRNQIANVKGRDLSSFLDPIRQQQTEVDKAKIAYENLRIAAKQAAIEARSAALLDANSLQANYQLIQRNRKAVVEATKKTNESKSAIRALKNEISLIRPNGIEAINKALIEQRRVINEDKNTLADYKQQIADLKGQQSLAKSFKLDSQSLQLAEFNRLNGEIKASRANILGLTKDLRDATVAASTFANTDYLQASNNLKLAKQNLANLKQALPEITGLRFYQDQLQALKQPIANAQAQVRNLRLEMQKVGQVQFDGAFRSLMAFNKSPIATSKTFGNINSFDDYTKSAKTYRQAILDTQNAIRNLKEELRKDTLEFKIGSGEGSLKSLRDELFRLKQNALDTKNLQILPVQKNIRDAQQQLREFNQQMQVGFLDARKAVLGTDWSIRDLNQRIRNVRADVQAITPNFNQAFRDEGVVNLLDKTNQLKKAVVDLQKSSVGTRPLTGANQANLVSIESSLNALKSLQTAYDNLGGKYQKGTTQANAFLEFAQATESY
jgi:chromosome segregation ATPase